MIENVEFCSSVRHAQKLIAIKSLLGNTDFAACNMYGHQALPGDSAGQHVVAWPWHFILSAAGGPYPSNIYRSHKHLSLHVCEQNKL